MSDAQRRKRALLPLGTAALFRQTAVNSGPVALGLGGLLVLGLVPLPFALVGFLVSLPLSAWLAYRRQREVDSIAAWLERLPEDQSGIGGETADSPIADRVRRPVLEILRQARQESRRIAAQQRMLASVIEAVPDPILLIDGRMNVVQANAAARRAFSAPAGRPPLVRVVRDPGLLAAVSGTLASGSASSVAFSTAVDLNKQFSCRIEPVDLGDEQGVLVALREQTEQVMIERIRSDFVANASHEIRNPLAAIQGFIETLQGPARHDPGARDQFLGIMAEEAARMARLVDDLLSLSRIELAANRPPTQQVSLRAVLDQVLERMRRVAEKQQVEIADDAPAILPEVVGDPDQLHQLFVNLLDNAIKYGGARTTVRLDVKLLEAAPAEAGAAAGRPSVQVAVSDRGPGIPAEHLPRLTERFYRVDKGRSRRMGGTGLGLAIVKHIVRRHQGHLDIASEIGKGSTFAVTLPLGHASVTENA
ncbi:MAG: ATP-binding protein [Geminicoccaceae bacterium]